MLASILFAAIGVAALLMARGYTLGSSASMGPGYFPAILGGALIVLGAVGIVQARIAGDAKAMGNLPWRQLLLIPLSVVSFAVLLERAGLAPAVFTAAMLAALAAARVRFWQALISAVLLTLLTSVLFVKLLALPVTIGPPDW